MFLRASGFLTSCENRTITRTRDGKQFTIPSATLRVNGFIETDVTVADALMTELSEHMGEWVDLAVDVSATGGYPRAKATGFWPADEVGSLHAVAV